MDYFSNWDTFYKLKPQGGQWGNEKDPPDIHVKDFFESTNLTDAIILDSGCADGKNTNYISSLGHTTYGIDISETVINRVKNKVKGKFSVQDCKQTNFKDNMFDAIIDAGCLHVNEPHTHTDILREYIRILKPNGMLAIRLFNSESNSNMPIFSVAGDELYMPVYGFDNLLFEHNITTKFKILDYKFDPNYSAIGKGCHYYILARID